MSLDGHDLTCIVTSRNSALTIGATIASALSHGCRVHVYDNASTDATAQIARSFDVPLTVHEIDSRSPVRGFNEGIDDCTTAWLMFLDSDDVILDVSPMLIEGADWAVPRIEAVQPGRSVRIWDYSGRPTDFEGGCAYAAKHTALPVTMKGVFRAEWIRENGLRYLAWPDGHAYSDDCLTCLEWMKLKPRIEFTPSVCLRYSYHPWQRNHYSHDLFLRDLRAYVARDASQ